MNKDTTKSGGPGIFPPMSPRDFTEWGVQYVAYVKPVVFEDKTVYAIFAANGQQLGMADTLAMAQGVIIQNDLEPVNVH